eukprot:s2791_g6.t3
MFAVTCRNFPASPPRFEGRVKWFSKEKGFGKILCLQPNAAGELGEEVFVHKSRFDGGPDGPHAQAVAEGSLVTFEIITSQVDGKPTACHVQERRVTSSGSSSSTEPASTDLPSPEAVLTTEQRLHYLRLALAAPEITDRLKKKHLQKRLELIETARDSSEGSKDSTDSTSFSSSSRGHGALLCLVWAVGLIEGLGILALPAVALPLISDLGLSLQNLMAALADANAANRKTLLALGMFSNGGLTCSFAAANAFVPLILLGALNAIAMASLRSVSLGLLAEVTSEQYRGRIFGCFSLAKHLGIALGCFANPWLCSQSLFGFEGWRIAILACGLLSILLSLFVSLTMKEPLREARLTDMEPGVRAELWRLARYCRFPSFLLIVFAGC